MTSDLPVADLQIEPSHSRSAENFITSKSRAVAKPGRMWLGSPVTVWVLACVAILVWCTRDAPGWDAKVTDHAIRELAEGHNPYTDGVAALMRYHFDVQQGLKLDPPSIYVYPPITLPVLRLLGKLPAWVNYCLYWTTYIGSTVTLLLVGMQFAAPEEKMVVRYIAPLAVFFPGLLANGTVMSGNVAIILYGVIFLAALCGWRRAIWSWFYLAVLIASCIKGPFLLCALIPVFSTRGQWARSAATVAAGLAIVALQAVIAPGLVRDYFQAIDLMFRYSRDFGCGPAGLFGDLTSRNGHPYVAAFTIFYALYAVSLLGTLLYFSRRYLRGDVSWRTWIPILLVGITLLNPRVIDYDVAPITLPLALVTWRSIDALKSRKAAIILSCMLFAAMNGLVLYGWEIRKIMDGLLLAVAFLSGCRALLIRTGGTNVVLKVTAPITGADDLQMKRV